MWVSIGYNRSTSGTKPAKASTSSVVTVAGTQGGIAECDIDPKKVDRIAFQRGNTEAISISPSVGSGVARITPTSFQGGGVENQARCWWRDSLPPDVER
jgi:hypothetical protein